MGAFFLFREEFLVLVIVEPEESDKAELCLGYDFNEMTLEVAEKEFTLVVFWNEMDLYSQKPWKHGGVEVATTLNLVARVGR